GLECRAPRIELVELALRLDLEALFDAVTFAHHQAGDEDSQARPVATIGASRRADLDLALSLGVAGVLHRLHPWVGRYLLLEAGGRIHLARQWRRQALVEQIVTTERATRHQAGAARGLQGRVLDGLG